MVLGGTMTTLVAIASWCALTFVGVVRATGGTVPNLAVLACALVAAPVAIAGAVHAVASFWRGPTILAFGRADAVPCNPAEAAFVRATAQLRGTMGGAGYLYPRRLVLPALAWIAAAVVGLGGISNGLEDAMGPWPVVVTVTTAFAALMLPARAYYYRETTGGGALLSPPSAAYRLRTRAAIVAAIARGEPVSSPTPAPTPPPARLSVSSSGQRDRA